MILINIDTFLDTINSLFLKLRKVIFLGKLEIKILSVQGSVQHIYTGQLKYSQPCICVLRPCICVWQPCICVWQPCICVAAMYMCYGYVYIYMAAHFLGLYIYMAAHFPGLYIMILINIDTFLDTINSLFLKLRKVIFLGKLEITQTK
jgi:hypothetical protein